MMRVNEVKYDERLSRISSKLDVSARSSTPSFNSESNLVASCALDLPMLL